MRQVMGHLDGELQQIGIASRTYFHKDVSKSMRQSVFDLMIEDRFDGIIQLNYDPVNTSAENSMYLTADYLIVVYTPAADGGSVANFERGCEERYRIWSEGLRGSPSTGAVASNFIQELRTQMFGD